MRRLIYLILALVAGGVNAAPNPTLQQIKTVFVIALENHDFKQPCPDCAPQQLFGNPAAPYLNSLVTSGNSNSAQVSYATAYYSLGPNAHPSEPNYIWAEGGTDFGICTDNDPSPAFGNLFPVANHLSAQLNNAGIPWASYQEDLEYTSSATVSSAGVRPNGTNIYNGSSEYYYAVKHNPMQFYPDTQNQNVYPLAQLWSDLDNDAVGSYNWITPDEFNEMHSGLPGGFNYQGVQYWGDQAAIAAGDNCLSIIVPMIMASAAYQDNGVIIIWTDETESTDDTRSTLTEIIISPLAKGNAYASQVPMNHSSDLKTMDEIFGLEFQTHAVAQANDLGDMFQESSIAPVVVLQSPNLVAAPTTTATGDCASSASPPAGSVQLTFSGPANQTYEILASSNLQTPQSAWRAIARGTFSGTNDVFTDLTAPEHTSRYYVVKAMVSRAASFAAQ